MYGAYKLPQVQSAFLHSIAGWSNERLEKEQWEPHHTWAGQELHELAVNTRGLYLKVGVRQLMTCGPGLKLCAEEFIKKGAEC